MSTNQFLRKTQNEMLVLYTTTSTLFPQVVTAPSLENCKRRMNTIKPCARESVHVPLEVLDPTDFAILALRHPTFGLPLLP